MGVMLIAKVRRVEELVDMPKPGHVVDDIDARILRALTKDPRATVVGLAEVTEILVFFLGLAAIAAIERGSLVASPR